MSRLSSSDMETPEQSGAKSTASQQDRNGAPGESEEADGTDATATQGSSAYQETSQTNKSGAESQETSRLDRVEELMDTIGKKVGSFTSMLGQKLVRLAAHAREGVEDCWAEAQSMRRGEPQDENDKVTR
jgi:hypothetical protein